MTTLPPTEDTRWHLDRRIPIVLVITVLAQTAGIVWWASGISSRVTALEIIQQAATPAGQSRESRIVRLETLAETTKDRLDAIDEKLDKLLSDRTQ